LCKLRQYGIALRRHSRGIILYRRMNIPSGRTIILHHWKSRQHGIVLRQHSRSIIHYRRMIIRHYRKHQLYGMMLRQYSRMIIPFRRTTILHRRMPRRHRILSVPEIKKNKNPRFEMSRGVVHYNDVVFRFTSFRQRRHRQNFRHQSRRSLHHRSHQTHWRSYQSFRHVSHYHDCPSLSEASRKEG